MQRSLPAVVLATLLIVLLAVTPRGVVLALPLAAFAVVAAILFNRPRHPAWRWAALGSLLWGFEETVWAGIRLSGAAERLLVTDLFYFSGAAVWAWALWRLPGRGRPRGTLVVFLPPMLLLGWLLTRDTTASLTLQFPWVDAALLLVAFPALDATLRGRASEGRLLWVLGFFIRALTAANYSWLSQEPGVVQLSFLLWLVGYLFLALGLWLELRGEPAGLWLAAYTVLGLEAVVGVMFTMLGLTQRVDGVSILVVALLLAYSLFASVMLLIAGERRRRVATEREFRDWVRLMERLVESSPAPRRPADAMGQLLTLLREPFPSLAGIDVYGDAGIRVGVTAGYAFPIVSDGTEMGHLYFRRRPGDSTLLDALALLVANQIKQALSQDEWRTRALSDPLTGLLNRRGLESREATLLALARSRQQPVSVVMLDLDHFKRVNDYHGHATGDELLKGLATVVRRTTRSDDLAIRWGGEEFTLILYGSDLDTARDVTRRIQSELGALVVRPVAWPLTLSAGIAGGRVPRADDTLADLIAEADAALLRAKEAGRDRIEIAL